MKALLSDSMLFLILRSIKRRILETILNIDIYLFNLINQSMSNQLFDLILVPIRYQKFWIPFYVFIIGFLLLNRMYFNWTALLVVLATVGFSDTMSSKIIKPLVERPRPCHKESNLDTVQLRVRCGGGFSFTSSHATNHFAVATILFLIFGKRNRKLTSLLFVWAAFISVAQVYVGVHYPLDIFFGCFLGITLASLVFSVYKMYLNYYLPNSNFA